MFFPKAETKRKYVFTIQEASCFFKWWQFFSNIGIKRHVLFVHSISVCNRNIPDRRPPRDEARMLSCGRRKLPVLSNIKAATARQNNRLITEEERRREACFLTGLTSFFWRVTLWLYGTRLLCIQKVREINQNPHTWLARFITATRVKVFAVIRFPPPKYEMNCLC